MSSIGAVHASSLQQIAAFAATARHGSFAAAAREVGCAPSTLAKSVARLEQRLGVRLFHRTTRQVSLTPDGERLAARCERLLAEVDELQSEAAGVRGSATGVLRVDAPTVLGKQLVLPALGQLARAHPGLAIDLRLQDAYADLAKEGLDLAVRVGALKDSSLVARPLLQHAMVLVASPAYLASRGTPRRLEQLARHEALVFRLPSSGRDRPWSLRRQGEAVQLQPAARLRIGDGEALVEAAVQGFGIAQLPDYFVRRQLADGALAEVLPGLRPAPLPVSLVWPAARMLPHRVRLAIDALTRAAHDWH